MKKISLKQKIIENISLAKTPNLSKNTATTKHTSAQPSRHPLAIFMPNVISALSVIITSLQDTAFAKKVLAAYGGLIGVNTRPKGNSPSRMYAVVETCHPIYGVVSLTKHTGAIMQTFLTSILAKLSHFTPLESLALGAMIGLSLACLIVGFLFVMGV